MTTRPPVEQLLRGISTNHIETVRDAWRALLENPESSVSDVRAKLASSAWKTNPRGPVSKYFGVLLAVLDELNSEEFRQEIARLRKKKLHLVHRRSLDLMAKRVSDQPATYLEGRIPVFVAADIKDQSVVVKNLQRWSRTKDLSLDNVTRIDVIALRPELDYLGKYNLFFSNIILTWPTPSPKGLWLWVQRLSSESTFYHEVGHHALGHSEGGQVAEQEKEADDYARLMLRKSRPVLFTVGRALIWPFKPWLRRRRRMRNKKD